MINISPGKCLYSKFKKNDEWCNKEIVKVDRPLGYNMGEHDGVESSTAIFVIHYSLEKGCMPYQRLTRITEAMKLDDFKYSEGDVVSVTLKTGQTFRGMLNSDDDEPIDEYTIEPDSGVHIGFNVADVSEVEFLFSYVDGRTYD